MKPLKCLTRVRFSCQFFFTVTLSDFPIQKRINFILTNFNAWNCGISTFWDELPAPLTGTKSRTASWWLHLTCKVKYILCMLKRCNNVLFINSPVPLLLPILLCPVCSFITDVLPCYVRSALSIFVFCNVPHHIPCVFSLTDDTYFVLHSIDQLMDNQICFKFHQLD